MNLLAMVHGFPPMHNAGAEWMLFDLLKKLTEKGHKCKVMIPITGLKDYNYQGIEVVGDNDVEVVKKEIAWCDIIISHLDRYGKALNRAEFFGKPYVLLVHNTHRYAGIAEKHKTEMRKRWLYVVYNTEYTRDALRYPNPGIVVHPFVDAERVRASKKEKVKYVTLINLWEGKGGKVLQQLAKEMPDVKFMGVKGGYGYQEIDENIKNIRYVENTPDISSIYAKTKILIMPSKYESFGRTALEAMINGIPVIASPTEGLKENLGEAGIFVNHEDIEGWKSAIRKLLDDKDYYEEMSKKCLERADEFEKKYLKEIDELEIFLMNAINKKL